MRQEDRARLGEAGAATGPVEERAPQFALEEVEASADRGLREVKRARRPGEAAAPGDGHEGLDLIDLHAHQHS